MYNLNKKQKIIIVILVIILMCGFWYYIYNKNENIVENNSENIILNEQQENLVNEESNEEPNIIVHISGAVAKEGIVELKKNSRIADAIEKAGGLKEDADMSKINLAFMLEDGMKVYIPSINEKNSDEQKELVTKSSGMETTENNVTTQQNEQVKVKVNINTATEGELETLPGIGPSTASKILQYRKENGKFNNIDEIKKVSGIGESKYNKIKDLIVVK